MVNRKVIDVKLAQKWTTVTVVTVCKTCKKIHLTDHTVSLLKCLDCGHNSNYFYLETFPEIRLIRNRFIRNYLQNYAVSMFCLIVVKWRNIESVHRNVSIFFYILEHDKTSKIVQNTADSATNCWSRVRFCTLCNYKIKTKIMTSACLNVSKWLL